MLIRFAAAAAFIAITAGLVSLIPTRPIAAAIDMAEVERQVAATKNVSFNETVSVDGKFRDRSKVIVSGSGVMRAEEPGGYSVINFRDRKAMIVRPKEQRVTLLEGGAFHIPEALNFYVLIQEITKNPVKELSKRQIDGRVCKGVAVKILDRDADVWVDPEAKLPVLIEMTLKEDGHSYHQKFDDFTFDKPLDDSILAMIPPKDFTVETFGVERLADQNADQTIAAPTVTAHVGIGPAKFGMTEQQVIDLLGKPDRENVGERLRILSYYSRGYELWVMPSDGPRAGLYRVACLGQHGMMIKLREFQGKTDKGIGLGASKAEIVKIYGEPSYEHVSRMKDVFGEKATDPEKLTGQTELTYSDLDLSFTLYNDKVYQINLSAPRPKPANAQ